MSTDTDPVQVTKIVGPPPAMVTADVQELLIHRVTEAAIERVKKKILATVALLATVASVLGLQTYLQARHLSDALAEGVHKADSIGASLAERNASADRLLKAFQDSQTVLASKDALRREAFERLLTQYQQTAASSTEQALTAAANARSATENAGTRFAAVETLRTRIDATTDAFHRQMQDFDSLRTRIDDRVFGTWTAVLDEHQGYVPVGSTHFQARAIRIHNARIVEMEIADRDNAMTLLCGGAIELSVGEYVDCPYGGHSYRVTLLLAMKQGGLLARYHDRAQVQLARYDTPADPRPVQPRRPLNLASDRP